MKKQVITTEEVVVSPIRTPADATKYFVDFAKCEVEHFVVMTINSAYIPVGLYIVSKGTVNRTLVHVREVFRQAIIDNAVGIIVCHNHPSGKVEPSKDDVETTIKLQKAGEIIGIEVLDHVIVGGDSYFSFSENGMMKNGEKEMKVADL